MGMGRRKKLWLKCRSWGMLCLGAGWGCSGPGWVEWGAAGTSCSSSSSHGEWGPAVLPSLQHANRSPKQEKHCQAANLPYRTQQCAQAPVQIHRALPVGSLQPVITLKATIKTIETHVMGLGSIVRLIPTSIPEERRRGDPKGWKLVLCWAGRDGAGLQRTTLGERRWQPPGPQPAWHPRSHTHSSADTGAKGWVGCGRAPRSPSLAQSSPGSCRKSAAENTPSPEATFFA